LAFPLLFYLQHYCTIFSGKTWRIRKNVPASQPITPMWSFQLALLICRSSQKHCAHVIPRKTRAEWRLGMAMRHSPIDQLTNILHVLLIGINESLNNHKSHLSPFCLHSVSPNRRQNGDKKRQFLAPITLMVFCYRPLLNNRPRAYWEGLIAYSVHTMNT